MRSRGARPELRSRQRLLGRSFVPEKGRGGRCESGGQRPWPDPAPLRLQAPRLPGQGLRRCFSNSDSSSKNSNQQVCGGVQGRLEVAASRSAASALILPPPPLPPGTLPASNLTLGREPRGCDPPNRQERDCSRRVSETLTIQNGRPAPPELGRLDRLPALAPRANRCSSWRVRGRNLPPDPIFSGLPWEMIRGKLGLGWLSRFPGNFSAKETASSRVAMILNVFVKHRAQSREE